MKKFDYIEWKKGAKIKTRSGHEVTDLTAFKSASMYKCLAGVVNETLYTWSATGECNNTISDYDLVIVEDEMWTNVYNNMATVIYPTMELSLKNADKDNKNYKGTYKLIKPNDNEQLHN